MTLMESAECLRVHVEEGCMGKECRGSRIKEKKNASRALTHFSTWLVRKVKTLGL